MRTRVSLLAVGLTLGALSTPLTAQYTNAASLSASVRAANSANFAIEIAGISGGWIVSPRDPASGQATGKRQHKPIAAHSTDGKVGDIAMASSMEPPTEEITFVLVSLSADGGGACKVRISGRYNASAKMIDIQLGDVARFFNTNKSPKPDLCNGR